MKSKETKISRENLSWLLESPMEIKMTLLLSYLTICQLIINQILEEGPYELAGLRYGSHKNPQGRNIINAQFYSQLQENRAG